MITSHITPSKRQFSAELEAMFQEHVVKGNETKKFRHGESGGVSKFYAGDAKKQVKK